MIPHLPRALAIALSCAVLASQGLAESQAAAPAAVAKTHSRLQAGLDRVASETLAKGSAALPRLRLRHPGLRFSDGTLGPMVTVEVVAKTDPGALAQRLRSVGARDVSQFGRRLSARVPVSALKQVAADPELLLARPSRMHTRRGGVVSQGDISIRGPQARALPDQGQPTGDGIKVGVISDSFDCLGGASGDVGNNEYPSVQVLKELAPCAGGDADGTDEGRAMVQIVADVAPGSTQAFYTGFLGQADFANGVLALANAGAQVIVDDVAYLDEPYFQDGIMAQAIDQAVAAGTAFFSAAGNDGRQSYESDFRPTNALPVDPNASGLSHDFDPGPGVATEQAITLAAGQSITLTFQWDAPFASSDPTSPGADSDLDIFLLDTDGTVVAFANDTNRIVDQGGGDAVEVIDYTNTSGSQQTVFLRIDLFNGNAPRRIKYINSGEAFVSSSFATNSSTSFGHPIAAGAYGVGAAAYFNTPACGQTPPLLEPYSSAGGLSILMQPNGTRLATPDTRQKPDAVGPDGGNTTFFGDDIDLSTSANSACLDDASDTRGNFFGTSAAAPHVAGVAALMLQAKPGATPAQLYAALNSTARDFGPAGFDFDNGFGLVRADAAVAAIAPPLPTVTLDTNATVANERAGTRLIGLTLSAVSATPVTVPFTFGGGATLGSDYSLPDGATVTIPAGQLSGSLRITLINDALDEVAEQILFSMGSPTNASRGAITSGILEIRDDDLPPKVSLNKAAATVAEGGRFTAFNVRLSEPSGKRIVVRLNVSGTATRDADYSLNRTVVVIPPGWTFGAVRITPLSDAVPEGAETVIVDIASVTTGAQIIAPSRFTATITNVP